MSAPAYSTRSRAAASGWGALPEDLLVRIASLLAVDARLAAAGVNKHWRAALAAPSLWECVDVRRRDIALLAAIDTLDDEAEDGYTPRTESLRRAYVTLVRAAARRARRRLEVRLQNIDPDDVHRILTTDAPHVRELYTDGPLDAYQGKLRRLLDATRLEVVEMPEINVNHDRLRYVNWPEGVLRRVRVQCVEVPFFWDPPQLPGDFADTLRDTRLAWDGVQMYSSWDGTVALLDAATARRVSTLSLTCGQVSAAILSSLAALLRAGTLTKLELTTDVGNGDDDDSDEEEGASQRLLRVLIASLPSCDALRELQLRFASLWSDPTSAVAILQALACLPSLATLRLQQRNLPGEAPKPCAAVRAALAALVRANRPALRQLDVSHCDLGACALAELLCALSHNTHLHELRCRGNLRYDDAAFDDNAAAAVGAALRANASLRLLDLADSAHPAFVQGLVGHRSLRTLNVDGSRDLEQAAALGAALGELVAANAPAVTDLSCCDCDLRAAGLRPLLATLPCNTHLRVLVCHDNVKGSTFARNVLLPAVRANTSLLKLFADGKEAQALVKRRAEAAPLRDLVMCT